MVDSRTTSSQLSSVSDGSLPPSSPPDTESPRHAPEHSPTPTPALSSSARRIEFVVDMLRRLAMENEDMLLRIAKRLEEEGLTMCSACGGE